jgi:hypothetical protein
VAALSQFLLGMVCAILLIICIFSHYMSMFIFSLRITVVDVPKVSFSPTRGGFLVSASNIGLSVKGDFRIVKNIIK